MQSSPFKRASLDHVARAQRETRSEYDAHAALVQRVSNRTLTYDAPDQTDNTIDFGFAIDYDYGH